MKRLLLLVCLYACASVAVMAQEKAQQLADSIVKYQMKSGGWAKNQKWLEGVAPKEAKEWRKTGIGATIDNGATVTEMKALAKAVDKVCEIRSDGYGWLDKKALDGQQEKYRMAFMDGLDFLLKMQYPDGGFPQSYPLRHKDDYSMHITFNDNAMVNVLKLLRDVANGAEEYKNLEIDKSTKKKCLAAYEKGIRCILDCQIRVDKTGKVTTYGSDEWKKGKRTVWCQQHDKKTLAPAKARSYELPSYTGHGETVNIIELLMDVQSPSDEVKEAVKCAVEWLEAHAMKDVAVETFVDEQGRNDIRLVEREGAPWLWARFYDLHDAEPMYCDRDGVPVKNLSDIGHERRNGYRWVGDSPRRVIDKFYGK